MTISNQNVELYRGDTETVSVALVDVNGDPFTLSPTGVVRYRVSFTAGDDPATALIVKDLNNGILIDNDTADITLLSEDTDLTPGVYYHELKIFDVGDVATAMVGAFIIKHSLRMSDQQQSSKLSVSVNADVV